MTSFFSVIFVIACCQFVSIEMINSKFYNYLDQMTVEFALRLKCKHNVSN